MSEPISPPAQDIYVVEFERRPGDLGASVIVRANCAVMAKLEALRLFPEYKRVSSGAFVHSLDYAEIDWQSGQCFVMKRKRRPAIPVVTADEPTERRRNTKREEGTQ